MRVTRTTVLITGGVSSRLRYLSYEVMCCKELHWFQFSQNIPINGASTHKGSVSEFGMWLMGDTTPRVFRKFDYLRQ